MDNKKWEAFFDRLALAIDNSTTLLALLIVIGLGVLLVYAFVRILHDAPFMILVPIFLIFVAVAGWAGKRVAAIEERKSR